LEEVDPEWANICSTFVVSLETKVSKVRAAQHSFHAARKRKQQQEERLQAKFIKLEQQTKETPNVPVENGIEPPPVMAAAAVIQPKLEPVDPVEPEAVAAVPLLIPKVLDEDEKSVLSDSSSEALPVRLRKKVQAPSSSESDYEEELTLAERQQHRRRVVVSSSSTEQSESSTEESDWSDDVGKAKLRNTRTKGRNYNTRRTKGSKKEGVKTRGRRRLKSSTSSDEVEEEEEESDSASESPEPRRRTRRTAQRSKSSSRSPSPEVRKTRNSKLSKKPVTKKVVETPKVAEVKTANNKVAKAKAAKEKKEKEKENKSATKKGAKIVASEKPDKNVSENSQDNGFYPGWESELVKFKQSLRMPSNLIRVHSRPNSDPPTPTKKRRGVTDSPISDCGGARGKKGDPETPVRKKVIRDVELSDSSCSMPGRPRKKNEKVSQDVLKKLATKLKSKVGALKKALKSEEQQAETKKETLPPRRGLRKRRRSSRLSGNLERRHLRSAAQHRSNRILINSKKHLRRRDMKVKVKQEGTTPKPAAAKKPGRGKRKLRSSGFDYLRKRKKKKEGSETSSICKKVRHSYLE